MIEVVVVVAVEEVGEVDLVAVEVHLAVEVVQEVVDLPEEGLPVAVVHLAVGAVEEEHLEAVEHLEVVVEAHEEEPREAATSLLSLTDTLVSSSLKERNTCSSQRTSYLAKQYTERRESAWRALRKRPTVWPRRSNTECGTPSDRSLLPVFWEDWTTFTSNQARKCFISVLQVERV